MLSSSTLARNIGGEVASKASPFLSRLNLVVQRYELGRTLDEPVFF